MTHILRDLVSTVMAGLEDLNMRTWTSESFEITEKQDTIAFTINVCFHSYNCLRQ